MEYFISQKIKLVFEDNTDSFAIEKEKKVGIQVKKNNVVLGEKIKGQVERKCGSINPVILADSDRCCIDWVGIFHSNIEYLLKASFSCPLLGVRRSSKNTKNIEIGQYIPAKKIAIKCIPTQEKHGSNVFKGTPVYLAADSSLFTVQKYIQEELSALLQAPIKIWKYSTELEDNSAILVISDNKGFIEYFKENTRCVCLTEKDLEDKYLAKKIATKSSLIDTERTKKIVSKLALADKIQKAKVIGIVFTSGDYMDLVHSIAYYLDMHGKKFYHFFINGLKPEKLGNFIGVDAFVVVQCPFSSFRFEDNIIAVRPYDLVLAFAKEWDGKYQTDLEIASRVIVQEIQRKRSISGKNSKEQFLQIKSGANTLDLRSKAVQTEQLTQYFRTGEFLKRIQPNTIPESMPDNPERNKILAGYDGIPTNYRRVEDIGQ